MEPAYDGNVWSLAIPLWACFSIFCRLILGYTIIYNSRPLSSTPCISFEIAIPGQINLKAFQQLNSVVRYILNLLLLPFSLSVDGPSAAFRLRWNADICVEQITEIVKCVALETLLRASGVEGEFHNLTFKIFLF